MGKYYCCMTDCSNFTGKIGRFGKTVTLHKLPSNPSLKRAWIIAISRKNWRAKNYTRVCSDHFKNGIGPNYFDREKVPTEFLAHKPIDTTEKTPRKPPKERTPSNTCEKNSQQEPQVLGDRIPPFFVKKHFPVFFFLFGIFVINLCYIIR